MIRDGGFSPDEYVTGWVKRGPTGVIGTNKSDAVETVTSLLHDVHDGELVPHGRSGSSTGARGTGNRAFGMTAGTGSTQPRSSLVPHGRLRTTLAHRRELLAAAEDNG